jgi:hypothetical protein
MRDTEALGMDSTGGAQPPFHNLGHPRVFNAIRFIVWQLFPRASLSAGPKQHTGYADRYKKPSIFALTIG